MTCKYWLRSVAAMIFLLSISTTIYSVDRDSQAEQVDRDTVKLDTVKREQAHVESHHRATEVAQAINTAPKKLSKGGVVFTFDDRNFDHWVEAIPLFDQFGVKATFFVSGEIDDQAATAIRKLKSKGHAIGSHSVHHLKAVEYFKQRSTSEFLQNEILPQMEQFKGMGVSPTSFAYPMSDNNDATDTLLLKSFRHIRTGRNISGSERLCEKDLFFVPATKISEHGCLYAKGIDHAPERPDRTFEQIDEAMIRAAERNEIIVFYAHHISKTGTRNFVTPAALTRIFSKAKQLNLQFYTFDDLP